MVCKLQRSIYGLKQASRSWNIRFDQAIKSYGFIKNIDDSCVYKKIQGKSVAFLVLYEDDILLIGNDIGVLTTIKSWLSKQFDIKDLGEANYILVSNYYEIGRVKLQPCLKRSISTRYCLDLAWKISRMVYYHRENVTSSLCRSCGKSHVYHALHQIRHLFCSMDGQQISNPIMKYLKRTKNYMLMYSGDELIPVGYMNFDFISDKDSRKSTSGYVFTLESLSYQLEECETILYHKLHN